MNARSYIIAAAPRSPHAHLVRTSGGGHLFVADGSRLFHADTQLFGQLESAVADGTVGDLLDRLGLSGTPSRR